MFAYHQQRRYEEAIDELKEVLRISPNHAASHGQLGRIYMEMGEHELALGELNRSLGISPYLIPALADRAGLLRRLGRHEEAERDVRLLESLGVDVRDMRAGSSDGPRTRR